MISLKVFCASVCLYRCMHLCAASQKQSSETCAATAESLDAITRDLITPGQVQSLQYPTALTSRQKEPIREYEANKMLKNNLNG